jgi:hypothetical protein
VLFPSADARTVPEILGPPSDSGPPRDGDASAGDALAPGLAGMRLDGAAGEGGAAAGPPRALTFVLVEGTWHQVALLLARPQYDPYR